MPRLLMALSYYHPYVSGLSEYARIVARGLTRSFEVTVLTGRHDPALAVAETIDGVRVERAAPWLFLHKGYLSFDLFRRFARLVRETDLVNLHLPMLEAGALASMVPSRTPLVVTYQCDLAATGHLVDRMAVAAVRASARMAMRRADRIVVLSRDYASGSRVLAGFEATTQPIFPPAKEPPGGYLPNLRDASTRPRRVGFLGRFVREKGIETILDALPLVAARIPDVRFVLAGERIHVAGGSMFDELRMKIERCRPNLEMPGSLPEESLAGFYASLDVLILPSQNAYEAFGMVQVEAMYAGVPVVASDLRGVRVPVNATGSGELCIAGDAASLAQAILRVFDRDWDRVAIRDRAAALFGTERTLADYEALFGRLLSSHRPAPDDAVPERP